MKSFEEYLTEEEAEQGKKLKHIEHPEDLAFDSHEAVGVAGQHLDDVHTMLTGKRRPTHVSTKYDGAPSVVFGNHPENGKFFVATKSAFNATPKINHTPQDIEANHGHAPGLVTKLKAALQHLPKIMPRDGGVFQGDLMHTPEDVKTEGGMHHFTPNTITYSTSEDSEHGAKLKNSKLGIVVHTQYKGRTMAGAAAGPVDPKTRAQFNDHPDVHNIDPTLKINPDNYLPDEQHAYLNHMENAKRVYARMKPNSYEALQGHSQALRTHINSSIRKGTEPSVDSYIEDLKAKQLKEPKKATKHAQSLQQVMQNKPDFEKAMELHSHIQAAKDVLTPVLARNNEFNHSINGMTTGPEGAVAADAQGNMTKLVNRQEFSRMNFLSGQFQKGNTANTASQGSTDDGT
jgi:hypothetical protein